MHNIHVCMYRYVCSCQQHSDNNDFVYKLCAHIQCVNLQCQLTAYLLYVSYICMQLLLLLSPATCWHQHQYPSNAYHEWMSEWMPHCVAFVALCMRKLASLFSGAGSNTTKWQLLRSHCFPAAACRTPNAERFNCAAVNWNAFNVTVYDIIHGACVLVPLAMECWIRIICADF